MKKKVNECIHWLIEKVSPDDSCMIFDDSLIQELISDLAEVFKSDKEIDLLDPTTWGGA